MLLHARKIINQAYNQKKLIFAFNTINAETTWAIARGVTAAKATALFEVSEKTINYLGLKTIVATIESIVQDKSITAPLAMHLDHGHSFEVVARAIQAGFSSVMIDGSALPYKANIALTKKVVALAHKHNVIVQGEVGALQPDKNFKTLHAAADLMTDPKQAQEFVKLTGVDSLAVAVGTLHGPAKIFHKLPTIDFERLEAIHKLCCLPLVLHGASGVPVEQLKKAKSLGATVANIDTEIRLAYLGGLHEQLQIQKNEYDPRVIMLPIIEKIAKLVTKKIKSVN